MFLYESDQQNTELDFASDKYGLQIFSTGESQLKNLHLSNY